MSEVDALLNNPYLTMRQKKEAAVPLLRKITTEYDDATTRIVELNDQIAALEEAKAWWTLPPKLEGNDCSRLHKLRHALASGRLIEGSEKRLVPAAEGAASLFLDRAQSFVIQHDWAAAFAGATDYDGEWKLPYMHCAFEFRISGRAVVVIAVEHESLKGLPETPDGIMGTFFVQLRNELWYCLGLSARDDGMAQFAWEQVRAISIALDAEVAKREIVRAPAKLNAARERAGKPPLSDYHVVRLDGRHRKQRFDGGGSHRSPRLHFRRGHWRHYESHKTWVRWTLVGNPALGFIDKDYRL